MEQLSRLFRGHFQGREARAYVLGLGGVFWGLIFVAWLSYPEEGHHSIMTHTFSFFGSFNEEHNPRYWWIFSVAMVLWGLGSLPVVAWLRRRFAMIGPVGATVGACFMALGGLGLALVGIFPDARAELVEGVRYTEVHEKAAWLVVFGFGPGILTYAAMLLRQFMRQRRGAQDPSLPLGRVGPPFAFWLVLNGVAVYMQIAWERLYRLKKAAAAAAGEPFGSSWSEGMKTWYSFPFWENLCVYALFLFLVWLVLALPVEE